MYEGPLLTNVKSVKTSILVLKVSFRALDWGDPCGIFGKALQILKLESLGQPMVKI